MSNEVVKPMHSEFPRWYREVGLDENRERLQRRWNGVSALNADATQGDIECMLRIVFRAKSAPTAAALDRIRQSFKQTDDMFDMSGNDRELTVLLGAALAVLLEGNDNRSARVALALTTSSMGGIRQVELLMDLPALAEVAIARISEHHRERPTLDYNEFKTPPAIAFTKAKAKVQEQADATGFGAAFELAAEAVNLAFQAHGKRLSASLSKTSTYIAIQDEELELLWWVFGERSDDLDKPFKEIAVKTQPLIFAKELAAGTQFLPGPVSAKSLLSRAGLKDNKKLTLPDAVNGCDVTWLASVAIQEDISPLSQPIHLAIRRKLETGDDTSWIAGWASICGIDDKSSLSALTLGNLFYRERLLSLFPEA